jgi:hypothetical protein
MAKEDECTTSDDVTKTVRSGLMMGEMPSLGDVLDHFVTQLDSLADTLPITLGTIGLVKGLSSAHLGKLQKAHAVSRDNMHTMKLLLRQYQKIANADKVISASYFVSLVSLYDAFLGRMIRALFLLKPQSLNISEKQVSFSELLEFGSIEAAREHIIEKEVEAVLRKSHSEQFEWLENHFGLTLRKGLHIWPQFIELTERRNLFVHTGGVVSAQYIDVCEKHGVVHGATVSRGQVSEITSDYFNKSYNCILELGIKLGHTLWRKVLPGDRAAADKNLVNTTYQMLAEKRFQIARTLLDFAVDQKKHSSEQIRRIFIINRVQSYKWSGEETEARKIVKAEDWSASSVDFMLAERVLLDEFENAAILMKRIGADGEVKKGDYRDWPLFTAFRKSDSFLATFTEVFGEPFCESTHLSPKELTEFINAWSALGSQPAAALITQPNEDARQLEKASPEDGPDSA